MSAFADARATLSAVPICLNCRRPAELPFLSAPLTGTAHGGLEALCEPCFAAQGVLRLLATETYTDEERAVVNAALEESYRYLLQISLELYRGAAEAAGVPWTPE